MNSRDIGNAGEDMACAYLKKHGWKILGRNVRCGRNEIDIIASRHRLIDILAGKRRLIAFIEVKRRKSSDYGRPSEAVNAEKQRRITRAAALYLQQNNLSNMLVRFDVIEVLPDEIHHIEGAFDAPEGY